MMFLAAFILLTCSTLSQARHFEPGSEDAIALDLIYETLHQRAQRIVGGSEAAPSSHPYQAGLFITVENSSGKKYLVFCGGSLISTSIVLTAAHCIVTALSANVKLGAYKIQQNEPSQVQVSTQRFKVNEGYRPSAVQYDIGLIYLPRQVQFSNAIRPIALPSQSDEATNFNGVTATVCGWGRYSSAQGISPVLRCTSNPIIPNALCAKTFGSSITAAHICLSGQGGRSSCNGDSGGPLFIDNKEKPLLIGIVSFGNGAGCDVGTPSVYTRVSSYLKWIQNNTGISVS